MSRWRHVDNYTINNEKLIWSFARGFSRIMFDWAITSCRRGDVDLHACMLPLRRLSMYTALLSSLKQCKSYYKSISIFLIVIFTIVRYYWDGHLATLMFLTSFVDGP